MRHVIFWEIHAWKECVLPHACSGGQGVSSVVDIFHATTATWSTAALSEARFFLEATSLPNEGLAIFAGGSSKCRVQCVAVAAGRLGLCVCGGGMVQGIL